MEKNLNELLRNGMPDGKVLEEYLQAKGCNHNNYKFYGRRKVVQAILDQHALFLSKGDHWNDINDRVNFNPADSSFIRFGLCMSFKRTESIAMWMIYGKDGLMIDLGKKLVKECIECKKIYIGNIKDNEFQMKSSLDAGEFQILLTDILYFSNSDADETDSAYVKRGSETFNGFPAELIRGLSFSKKTMPWDYECECRLVVTIEKKQKKIRDCDTVKIPFDSDHIEILKKRTYHFPYDKENNLYEKSILTGKVNPD